LFDLRLIPIPSPLEGAEKPKFAYREEENRVDSQDRRREGITRRAGI